MTRQIQLLMLVILLVPESVTAALPPLSPQQLHRNAELIIVGKAASVKASSDGKEDYTNWIVDLDAKVEAVEKAVPADMTETISVNCWRLKSRPSGWVGPSGHYSIPAKAARFRMWLRKNEAGTWEPLKPNGIQLLDGHAGLDFENPETVSKPVPSPEPEPLEAYQTASGTQYLRRPSGWSGRGQQSQSQEYSESGRDLSAIFLRSEDTGEELRIPRVSGKLQIMDQNGDWKNSVKIVRTIPPVTPEDSSLEILQASPAAQTGVSPDPLLPPDPSSVEEALAFVRTGNTWELLTTNYRSVDARYLEQYRDENVIQLQLIREKEFQTAHTLTILRTKGGGSVVLPDGGGFRRVPLISTLK